MQVITSAIDTGDGVFIEGNTPLPQLQNDD